MHHHDPIDPSTSTAPTFSQAIKLLRHACVLRLLRRHPALRTLILCRTHLDCANLHYYITYHNTKAHATPPITSALLTKLSQGDRDALVQQFASGKLRVLISTEVAGRGVDLPGVGLVVMASLPESASTFVHFAGRAGRSGAPGAALAIVGKGVEEVGGQGGLEGVDQGSGGRGLR